MTSRTVVLLRVAVCIVFVSATILQRFGLNLGAYSVSASFISVYFLLAVAISAMAMQFAIDRLIVFVVGAFLSIVGLLINQNIDGLTLSTATSLALLLAIYAPFILVLKPRAAADLKPEWVLRCLSNILLLCAFVGLAQFYLQFVFNPDWLFDFTRYIPPQFRGPSGYNPKIAVDSFYKSNCFFFLEPSHASFAMALGVLLEVYCFKRLGRAGIFALALLLTYSGTGLLALAIGMLLPFNLGTAKRLLVLIVLGVLAFFLLDDALNLSFTLSRLGEFNSERSSGYIRYVAPLRLVSEQILREPWTFWVGAGAGTVLRLSKAMFEFHDPTWAKLLVEYGVLGFISFVTIYLLCVFQKHLPTSLSITLMLFWLVMGGFLLASETVHFAYVIGGFMASRLGPESKPYPILAAVPEKWLLKV